MSDLINEPLKAKLVASYNLREICEKYGKVKERFTFDAHGNLYIFNYRENKVLKIDLSENIAELSILKFDPQKHYLRDITVNNQGEIYALCQPSKERTTLILKRDASGQTETVLKHENKYPSPDKIRLDSSGSIYLLYIKGRMIKDIEREIIIESYNSQGELVSTHTRHDKIYTPTPFITQGADAEIYMALPEHPYRIFIYSPEKSEISLLSNINFSQNPDTFIKASFTETSCSVEGNFWLQSIAYDFSRKILLVLGQFKGHNFIDVWTRNDNVKTYAAFKSWGQNFVFDEHGNLYAVLNFGGSTLCVEKFEICL